MWTPVHQLPSRIKIDNGFKSGKIEFDRYLTTRPNVEETVAHFELVIYGLSVGGIVVLSVKVVVDLFFIQMIQFLKNQNKLNRERRN